MCAVDVTPDKRPEAVVTPKLIDCDVHPAVPAGLRSILPYMPRAWQRRMDYLAASAGANGVTAFAANNRHLHPIGRNIWDIDARPPEGGPSGSSFEFLKHDFLDRYEVDLGLLILIESAYNALMAADPDHSAVLVSAYNDYMVEHWLSDDRVRYALTVTPLDSTLAVAEIKRHGRNPGVGAIYLPTSNTRMGSRHFHPIYKAASEFALPIITHPTGSEAILAGCASYAVGLPELFVEYFTDYGAMAQAQLTSLVMHGIFERFPSLQVMFVEYGFGWVVSHLWLLDKNWRQLRAGVPWVKRWPSEYVRDHVKFSTQPIVEPRAGGKDDPSLLYRLIEESELRDCLVYSSDYPHWDNDRPGTVLSGLSPDTKRKLLHENAAAVLRI
jgi:predicted TIM-barrel fold metal-dependent hydrolase